MNVVLSVLPDLHCSLQILKANLSPIIEWNFSSIIVWISAWIKTKAANQLYLNPLIDPPLSKQMDETTWALNLK